MKGFVAKSVLSILFFHMEHHPSGELHKVACGKAFGYEVPMKSIKELAVILSVQGVQMPKTVSLRSSANTLYPVNDSDVTWKDLIPKGWGRSSIYSIKSVLMIASAEKICLDGEKCYLKIVELRFALQKWRGLHLMWTIYSITSPQGMISNVSKVLRF